MLKNYLKSACRHLLKYKVYSFINLFGLALGIACCVLIFSYIRHEWSYDSFHENADSIYRVVTVTKAPGGEKFFSALQPVPLGRSLLAEFPEIKYAVRFINSHAIVGHENQKFAEVLTFADATILDVFSFPLRSGRPETAFRHPNSLVITAEMSVKYFGSENPLGKSLSIEMQNKTRDYEITAVLNKLPDNSSIEFDFLLPFNQYPFYEKYIDNWSSSRTNTYVQLQHQADALHLESKFPPLINRFLGTRIASEQTGGELSTSEDAWRWQLQPLRNVHLNPNVSAGMKPAGNPLYSYILGGIAMLVLLLACINFTTLAIGRSAGRAAEVGMRKVLGAGRRQLLQQFWGESIFLSCLATGAGVMLAELFLPAFNQLAGKQLAIGYTNNWLTWIFLVGLMFFVGMAAGGYPALLVSHFQPIEVLKSKLKIGGRSMLTRALVVLQYTLSIALVIATLVMAQQLHYLSTKNLGYDKDQVMVISTYAAWSSDEGQKLLQLFRNKLATEPKVLNVSGTAFSFARGSNQEAWQAGEATRSAYIYRVDANYLPTLDFKLLAGRNFSDAFPWDAKNSVIVNETLAREFGLGTPEQAVGRKLTGYDDGQGLRDPTIIGVVKDYHFGSLHEAISPAFLHINDSWPIYSILVKIAADDIRRTLDILKNSWQEIAPNKPFKYTFLEEDVRRQYEDELRWSKIVRFSAFVAILISCLGLFGLATLTSVRRTKEIGIRKVLGASAASVASLLSKDFIKLVLLAGLLSWPIAWYVMNHWLQNFAYRIEMGWWIFALASGLALVIALLTVSAQALKVALANPVDSLKYE